MYKRQGIPLSAYEDFSAFKLFMLDTGLMGAMSGLPPQALLEGNVSVSYTHLDVCKRQLFGRGFAWLDTGNCDSLLEASNFVATIQNRQGFRVSCIDVYKRQHHACQPLYQHTEEEGDSDRNEDCHNDG